MPDSALILLNKLQGNVGKQSSNIQMRFYYLIGRSYYSRGETPLAMHNFYQACDRADTTRADCDLHTLSRIYGQMARIFLEQDAPQNALRQMDIAGRLAKKDNDTVMMIAAYSQSANAYRALNMPDSAISVKLHASKLYLQSGDTTRAALAYGSIIDLLVDKGELALAKKYMSRYEEYSGLFDENGDIQKGFEIYYYTKSLYYLKLHRLDSAEYYARKVTSSSRFSDLESGYNALRLVFQEREQKDSLAKYAVLAFVTNDSVYRELSTSNFLRMQALYDYTRSQQVAEKRQKETDRLKLWLAMSVSVVLIVFIILWRQKEKKDKLQEGYARLLQEKIALEELVSKDAGDYAIEVEERQVSIEALEKRLSKAPGYKTLVAIDRALKSDEIVQKFRECADGRAINPTYSEWNELRSLIDKHLPHFVPTIKRRYGRISDSDIELCILIKLGFRTDQIAALLHITPSAVSKAKARLLPKIFKVSNGGAKDFERLLLKLY